MVIAVIWIFLAIMFRAPGCVGISYSSTEKGAYSSGLRANPGCPCYPPPILEEIDPFFFLTASLGYLMIRVKVIHESCLEMGDRSTLLLNQ